MNYQEINVPVQYRYLSQWPDLLNILPQQGKIILNKVNTGCGGTTLFLQSGLPTILVSPRSNVLYSKAVQRTHRRKYAHPASFHVRNEYLPQNRLPHKYHIQHHIEAGGDNQVIKRMLAVANGM